MMVNIPKQIKQDQKLIGSISTASVIKFGVGFILTMKITSSLNTLFLKILFFSIILLYISFLLTTSSDKIRKNYTVLYDYVEFMNRKRKKEKEDKLKAIELELEKGFLDESN